MPLHVTISLNDKPIQVLTISRTEEFKGKDYWHAYIVVTTNDRGEEEGAVFRHLYRDGAEECTRRALEALSNERERKGRGSRR
jgi:hypothetical protein